MYEFVDTNKAGSKSSLPSEALQIDGTYIENLIDGYRTLYVTGRELLGSEISEREIDLMDPRIRESEIQPEVLQLDTSCFAHLLESFRKNSTNSLES